MAMIVGLHYFVSGRAGMITNVDSISEISRTMYAVLMSDNDLRPLNCLDRGNLKYDKQ